MNKWKLILSALVDILLLRWNKHQEAEEEEETAKVGTPWKPIVDPVMVRHALILTRLIDSGQDTVGQTDAIRKQAGKLRRYCKLQMGETNIDQDVKDFNLKFGQPAPDRLELPSEEIMQFREDLILEEVQEFLKEWRDLRRMRNAGMPTREQMARVAAEAVDVVYVMIGSLVVLGMRLLPFWREVQVRNMQKQTNPNGGKPLKPLGWTKPDTLTVLNGEFDE